MQQVSVCVCADTDLSFLVCFNVIFGCTFNVLFIFWFSKVQVFVKKKKKKNKHLICKYQHLSTFKTEHYAKHMLVSLPACSSFRVYPVC